MSFEKISLSHELKGYSFLEHKISAFKDFKWQPTLKIEWKINVELENSVDFHASRQLGEYTSKNFSM